MKEETFEHLEKRLLKTLHEMHMNAVDKEIESWCLTPPTDNKFRGFFPDKEE
jgi:hypothetical protein